MVEGLSISPSVFFVRFLQFPALRAQYKRSKKIKPFDFLVQQYWGEKKRSRLNISAEFVVNNRICFLSSALSISCHPKISQKATHPSTLSPPHSISKKVSIILPLGSKVEFSRGYLERWILCIFSFFLSEKPGNRSQQQHEMQFIVAFLLFFFHPLAHPPLNWSRPKKARNSPQFYAKTCSKTYIVLKTKKLPKYIVLRSTTFGEFRPLLQSFRGTSPASGEASRVGCSSKVGIVHRLCTGGRVRPRCKDL